MLDLLFLVLAAVLGICLSRTSLCTVAALQMLLTQRRLDGVLRIALVSSCAALVLLAAAQAGAGQGLPVDGAVTTRIVIGGALLGVGAVVNGACVLGTVHYLSRGRLSFLFTLVGMAIAIRFGPTMTATAGAMPALSRVHTGLIVFAVVAVLTIVALRLWSVDRASAIVAGVTGIVAGLLYLRHPNWNYTSVVASLAIADRQPVAWSMQQAAVAFFTGAVAGALTVGDFTIEWPTVLRLVRCLAGGILMGAGAVFAGGGNDLLLLWLIPGLSQRGAVAYLVMAGCVGLLLALPLARRQEVRGATT